MKNDPEVFKIGFTIVCSAATTMITIGRAFHAGINLLNKRINDLSLSIAALDKNLAVQTAIFDRFINDKEKKQ